MENEEKVKKPFYKKWWFWLIIGLAVLGIIGGIGGGFAGSNSSNNSNNNTNQVTTEYKMKDKVVVGDLEYTISSAYNTVKIGSYGNITQNNYVVITIAIKNNDDSEKTLTSSDITYCRGSNKYAISTQGMYLSSSMNPFFVSQKIGAGISKIISVVYEIPSNYQATDYVLVKDSYHSQKIYMK